MNKHKKINIVILDNTNDMAYEKDYQETAEQRYKTWKVCRTPNDAVNFIKSLDGSELLILLIHANGREGYEKLGLYSQSFEFHFPKIKIYHITSTDFEIPNANKINYNLVRIGELTPKIEDNTIMPQKVSEIYLKSDDSNASNSILVNNRVLDSEIKIIQDIQTIFVDYVVDSDQSKGLYTDFNDFIEWLHSDIDKHWLDNLLSKTGLTYYESNFKNLYWDFNTYFFKEWFAEAGNKWEIQINTEVKEEVLHNSSSKIWYFKIEVFRRFLRKYLFNDRFIESPKINLDKVPKTKEFYDYKRLLRLYILHEVLHKIHGIDSDTVYGVGNFPRIVEEADYQADSYVIISEFFYTYSISKSKFQTKNSIIDEFIAIIKVAINTTMSFAGSNQLLDIQVRRFQRLTIWVFILALLERLRTKMDIDTVEKTLQWILNMFSVKPIMDVYGLKTDIKQDNNEPNGPKLFMYDLVNIDFSITKIGFFFNNTLEKTILDNNEGKIKLLINAIKESEYDILYKFAEHISKKIHF